MADPKVTDLEQIKKASMELGLSAEQAQKFVDALAKSSREVVEATKSQYEQLVKNKNLIQETYDLSELQYSNNIRISEEAKKSLEQRKELLVNIQEQQKEILKIEQDILILQKKKEELGETFSEEDEEKLKNLLQQKQLAEQKKEIEEEDLEVLQEQLEVLGKHEQLHKNIIGDLENQLASLTGMSGVWGNIQKGASISGALFAQFAANAGQLLQTVNQGNAQFARTTGQIAERSVTFGYGLSQFGVGFKELNEASAELYVSMSSFSNLNQSVQEDLAESAAKMNLLGVSVQTTAKSLNDLTKGMHMTAEEASSTNEYIARVAVGIGVAPKKMAEDFAAAMPKIQAHGKQGIEVFANLQKQAKTLGMEMNSLMGIVGDTFDTFEGGARVAGRLNAVLGGDYLNSVEMLNATEDERVEILKRSFDMSGKNWESMSKAEKQALANAAGIKDLNEASKLFNTSTTELTEDMMKQAASQEQLEKVQREAVETQKKMTEVFNALLVAVRPIVWVIEKLVNAFTYLNDKTGGTLGVLLSLAMASKFFLGSFSLLAPFRSFYGMVAGMPGKLSAMKNAISGAGGGLTGLKNLLMGGGGGGPPTPTNIPAPNVPPTNPAQAFSFKRFMIGIRDGLQAFAKNPGKTILGATVFAIAATLMSVPLMLIGYMISQKWIEPAGVLAFTAGLILLSVAMFIISQIAKPQMILGALMFGIAAVLVSFGIGMFADSFAKFNAIDFEKTLAGLGIVVLIMAAVFGLGALLTNPVALALFTVGVIGIMALGLAFTILGAGLMVLSSGLTGLTEFVKTLSDFSKVAESGAIITKTIAELSDAIASIPENKDVTLNALTNTLSVAKSITEEEVKPTKEFLNAAKEFYVAQENVGALVAATGMILAAVTQMTSALTSKNKSDDEPKMFKLVLNDGQTLTGKAYGTQNLSKKILGEG